MSLSAKSPIRLLYVDDKANFTDIIGRKLEEVAEEKFTLETGTSVRVGLDKLSTETYDCVVSKYDLPEQTGIEFVTAVRKEHPELPFILFTPDVNADIVSEAIASGVTDHVQQTNCTEQFVILANRITNAVEQYRATQRSKQQKASRARDRNPHSTFFEKLDDPSFMYVFEDDNPCITQINKAFTETFGYDQNEAVGNHVHEVIAPSDNYDDAQRISDCVLAGESVDDILEVKTAEGVKDFWVRNIPMTDTENDIDGYAIYIDHTVQYERERELERYKTVIEASGDPVYTLNADGNFTVVNEAFCEMTGYDEEQLLGAHFASLLTRADRLRGEEIVRSLWESETEHRTSELTLVRSDGTQIPCEIHITPLPSKEFTDSHGNVGIIRDITERKEREQKLTQARENLRQIIDLIPDPIYAKNWDDKVLLSNEENAALHGMTPDEIEGLREREIESDVQDINDFEKYLQREIEVMETGKAATFEEELIDTDGETHVFQTTRIPFETTGTDEEAVLSYARDVTELKEYEQQLEKLNTRLQLALEETDTGVWEWDLNSDEVLWDETSERLFGYEAGEFPSDFGGFADRVPEDDLQRVQEQIDYAIETGEQYRADFRVRLPTEDQRWVQARGVVEYDDEGEPERLLGIQTDITEQKERERQLQRQNERLDQFAGAVSHDLRNPLMVALARLDIIRDTAPDEHIETMERNLERMEEMIEDLLTLARLDQSDNKLDTVALSGAVRDAWDHANVADCEFESSIPESAKLEVDRNRLLQIFENLFRNAAVHNDSPVTVRVGLLSDHDSDINDGQRTGFFIEDNGTGIPNEQRGEIFDRGHTTSADGTGFGLSIVHDIIEEHGWSISVCDSEDGGARFEITEVNISH